MSGAIPADPLAAVPSLLLAEYEQSESSCCSCEKATKSGITTAILAAAIFATCFFTGVTLGITIVVTVVGSIFLSAIITGLFFQTKGEQIANLVPVNPTFIQQKVITPPIRPLPVKEAIAGVQSFMQLMQMAFISKGFFLEMIPEDYAKAVATRTERMNWGGAYYEIERLGLYDDRGEEIVFKPRGEAFSVTTGFKMRIDDLRNVDQDGDINHLYMDQAQKDVAILMYEVAHHIMKEEKIVKCFTSIREFSQRLKVYARFNQSNDFPLTDIFYAFCQARELPEVSQAHKDEGERIWGELSKTLADLFPVMRTFTTSFFHCADQPRRALGEYRDLNIDSRDLENNVEMQTLTQRILFPLQKKRSLFFMGVLREIPEIAAHSHLSNTEMYYNRIFQNEFNLGGRPLFPSNLDGYALTGMEDTVRDKFNELHTSDYLLETTLDLLNCEDVKLAIPSQMVLDWFKDNYPNFGQDKLIDPENGHWRKSAAYILLRDHKIIDAPK